MSCMRLGRQHKVVAALQGTATGYALGRWMRRRNEERRPQAGRKRGLARRRTACEEGVKAVWHVLGVSRIHVRSLPSSGCVGTGKVCHVIDGGHATYFDQCPTLNLLPTCSRQFLAASYACRTAMLTTAVPSNQTARLSRLSRQGRSGGWMDLRRGDAGRRYNTLSDAFL